MKILKWISLLVLSTLTLAACAPSSVGPSDASTTQTPAIDLPASPESASSAPVPATSGSKGGAEPQAALIARQTLAQQLGVGVSPEDIQIIKAEKTDWPDSCLGIQVQGMMCAQVIVPGYLVVLEHAGKQYEFRTDETGSDVRLAVAPEPQVGEVAISWQGQDGVCETALIGNQGVAFGPCGGTLMEGKFISQQRSNDLAHFVSTYASFAADTPAGKVDFTGKGSQTASEAEQRMIAEWSRLIYAEASGGRGGASYGLAITWHREGGFAGFCDDLEVYVSGNASATSCKGGQANQLGQGYLNADELSQLYSWVDSLKSFEVDQKDPATADAMSIRMIFQGMGSKEPTDADKTTILNFASQLYTELAQAGPASTPTENP